VVLGTFLLADHSGSRLRVLGARETGVYTRGGTRPGEHPLPSLGGGNAPLSQQAVPGRRLPLQSVWRACASGFSIHSVRKNRQWEFLMHRKELALGRWRQPGAPTHMSISLRGGGVHWRAPPPGTPELAWVQVPAGPSGPGRPSRADGEARGSEPTRIRVRDDF
jgi:hypothetical protein